MIILINCKSFLVLYENVFKKDSKIMKSILKLLKITKDFDPNKRLAKIYSNLFLDEYKEALFLNDLENLYMINIEKFTKVNTEALDILPKNFYSLLFEYLLQMDLTYDELFKNLRVDDKEKKMSK
jgi:hypothetical protein